MLPDLNRGPLEWYANWTLPTKVRKNFRNLQFRKIDNRCGTDFLGQVSDKLALKSIFLDWLFILIKIYKSKLDWLFILIKIYKSKLDRISWSSQGRLPSKGRVG